MRKFFKLKKLREERNQSGSVPITNKVKSIPVLELFPGEESNKTNLRLEEIHVAWRSGLNEIDIIDKFGEFGSLALEVIKQTRPAAFYQYYNFDKKTFDTNEIAIKIKEKFVFEKYSEMQIIEEFGEYGAFLLEKFKKREIEKATISNALSSFITE